MFFVQEYVIILVEWILILVQAIDVTEKKLQFKQLKDG